MIDVAKKVKNQICLCSVLLFFFKYKRGGSSSTLQTLTLCETVRNDNSLP